MVSSPTTRLADESGFDESVARGIARERRRATRRGATTETRARAVRMGVCGTSAVGFFTFSDGDGNGVSDEVRFFSFTHGQLE